jgi:hypothetical protein
MSWGDVPQGAVASAHLFDEAPADRALGRDVPNVGHASL